MSADLDPASRESMAVFKDARKRAYLNPAGDRALKSPLPQSTLVKARGYRKQRLVDQVVAHDCAAILLYDPVSIRYALDISNMQLWAAHNPFHYAMLFADGHAIEFAYRGAEHLADGLETINEIRPGNAWFYMYTAERLQERVDAGLDRQLVQRGTVERQLHPADLDHTGLVQRSVAAQRPDRPQQPSTQLG